ncbi:hypothetical protein OLX02_10285 [Novosphingobium sp. KCTC 2891]|uniref:head-tail connector protein n=1 Tax=Novosphingobium sp. KCTC 2891 TaxID=2989730 RepID=UPI0022234AFE|nr:hypothetical protein [Novosphingobium sp. KCTC 2891]MCW1383210.1 hypothetical protein [Novosphingobium sp. KCTC 2891]
MKRAIVAPPSLAPAALSELKAWLGISTSRDDAELTALIMTALDLCEGFTGTLPLQAGCEEVLPASAEWQALATRPVQAITGAAALAVNGSRTALSASDYEFDLDAEGAGLFRLRRPIDPARVVVTFTAGLASGWSALPDPLRHGIMRLAAHQHRGRDADKAVASGFPPAAVAALWRPWRRMRLA